MRKRIVKRVVEELEREVRSEARHRSRGRVEKHFRIGESRFMPQPGPPVENEVGFQQRSVFRRTSSVHHTWDKTKDRSDRRWRPVARFAVPRRAVGRKVARWWHVCG